MSQKVKVLQFTVAATKGGRTLYVLNNWKKINKEHIQFDFITFSPQLDFEEELTAEGCKVFHISCYPENNREQFIKELDEVLDNGYDVIHIHTSFWKDTIVEERAKAKGVKKIIIHSHSTGCSLALSKSEARSAAELHEKVKNRLTQELATDFLACSKKAAEWLYGSKIPEEKIRIMPNAIQLENFKYNPKVREKLRAKMRIEKDFVIGHVGRFLYVKNHSFLIDVFAEVLKQCSNVKLLLVGEGALEKEIKEKVENYNLTNQVIFAGKRNDVNDLMQAMDLFVFPSLFEGLGLVLIEAQAAGLKCIVSSEIPEEAKVVEEFEFLNLDKKLWIERIVSYIENPSTRQENIKALIEMGYDIDQQILMIEKLYSSESENKS